MKPALRLLSVTALLALASLSGCKMALPGGATDGAAAGLAPETLEVTPLDSATPAATVAAKPEAAIPATTPPEATSPPASGTTTAPETPPETAPAAPPKSAAQTSCEKSGGQWAAASDSGARSCVHPTRDAGKACTRGTQCQGDCLARSGTCSPIAPLFGCNDILQDNGVRTTLCRD